MAFLGHVQFALLPDALVLRVGSLDDLDEEDDLAVLGVDALTADGPRYGVPGIDEVIDISELWIKED